MKQYLNLMEDILKNGNTKQDRTGTGTISIFGNMIKYDISGNKLPLLTTKKMFYNSFIHETLWFLSGSTDIKYLKDNNVSIWDSWVKPETAKYDNDKLVSGSIGEGAYGASWRNWEDTRIIEAKDKQKYLDMGYKFVQTAIPTITNICGSSIATSLNTGISSSVSSVGISQTLRENPSLYVQQYTHYVVTRTIDQIANAIDLLRNNPDSRRIIVTAWNPGKLEDTVLPPCFSNKALVTMKEGYRYISCIKEGDEVITGNGNVKRVNTVYKTKYTGNMLRIKPAYISKAIECTPNHPFLIKGKGWVEAKDITIDDYLAVKKPLTGKDHSFCYYLKNRYDYTLNYYDLTVDDYFTLGYFLGNGWVNYKKNEIVFSIPNKKRWYILDKLRMSIKVSELKDSGLNVSKYSTRSHKWLGIFMSFGHGAENKFIPNWVFTSTKESINAFIEGYYEADGCNIKGGGKTATTVSPMLAYGIQRLSTINDIMVSVVFEKRPETCIIEGRTVNQRDTYSITTPTRNHYVEIDDDYLYIPIRSIEQYKDDLFVYNLDVEDDHTYIVNNVVTHNCHTLFQFYTTKKSEQELWNKIVSSDLVSKFFSSLPTDDRHVTHEKCEKFLMQHKIPVRNLSCMLYQRSCDYPVGNPFNIAQYALLTHMIAHVVNMDAVEFIWVGADTHIYLDQIELVKEQLKREPYEQTATVHFQQNLINIDTGLFSEIKNIDDIKFGHITIKGYDNYHPAIKYPVAV